MTSKIGNKRAGFSLIELLVVIGIILLMLGISVPYFTNFASKSRLESAATNINMALKAARSYAVTNNSNYIVHFDTSITPNQYWITDNLNNIIEKKYSLPANIDIYRPNNPSESITFTSDTASFNQRGGLNGTEGAVWISLGPEHIKFKRILVDSATGKVKIDETP